MRYIIESDYPVYVYESVHRITKTLEEMKGLGFVWHVMIARELSKLYEQYEYGTIDELLDKIQLGVLPLKGEFVIGFSNDQ